MISFYSQKNIFWSGPEKEEFLFTQISSLPASVKIPSAWENLWRSKWTHALEKKRNMELFAAFRKQSSEVKVMNVR